MNQILCIAAFVAVLTFALADELKIDVLFKPDDCGERISKGGDKLKMHYTGKLEDGTVFDSSLTRNQAFEFQLGVGQVIKGWDQGLTDMCIGEKRQLTIPSDLAYGKKGAGDKIPADATLHFEVELLGISDGPQPKNVFKEIDTDSDGQLSQEEFNNYWLGIVWKDHKLKPDEINTESLYVMTRSFFESHDANKDGGISQWEFEEGQKAMRDEQEQHQDAHNAKKAREAKEADKQFKEEL